ncbi:MAG: hypothetical protein ACRDH7_11110 [Actinomycetota bacterium]
MPSFAIADTEVVYGLLLALAPKGEDAERVWEHTPCGSPSIPTSSN